MSVTVRIPTVLRTSTGGESALRIDAATVREAFATIGLSHSGFAAGLLDEHQRLRPFVNVFVIGDDIRFIEQLDTHLTDGDEIAIVPAIAGG